MTTFRPFAAIRYAVEPGADLSAVMAPPYDVLSDADRTDLEGRDPRNAVRIDYPRGKEDPAAYPATRTLLETWLASGVLSVDDSPTYTLLRMTATDESGRTSRTTGVLGGLGLEQPGTGDVLPHEETTAKDKADRLNLIRNTRINTSPIWGLSLSEGLGALVNEIADSEAPLFFAIDDEGVRHEVWRVGDPARIAAITESVQKTPVVIADGHHRFETGLAYLAERAEKPGEATAILALIVELAPDQLDVRAIHRIITLPDPIALETALGTHFDIAPIAPVDATVIPTMAAEGFLTLITPNGHFSLRPKPGAFDDATVLDSQRVRIALAAAAPSAEVRYHHSVQEVLGSVAEQRAQAGILVRPATVAQIRAVADSRTRMPAKTTFFWPKPRSGSVFRPVD